MFHRHMPLWADPAFRENGASELDSLDNKNHLCTGTLVTEGAGNLFSVQQAEDDSQLLQDRHAKRYDCQKSPCFPD